MERSNAGSRTFAPRALSSESRVNQSGWDRKWEYGFSILVVNREGWNGHFRDDRRPASRRLVFEVSRLGNSPGCRAGDRVRRAEAGRRSGSSHRVKFGSDCETAACSSSHDGRDNLACSRSLVGRDSPAGPESRSIASNAKDRSRLYQHADAAQGQEEEKCGGRTGPVSGVDWLHAAVQWAGFERLDRGRPSLVGRSPEAITRRTCRWRDQRTRLALRGTAVF